MTKVCGCIVHSLHCSTLWCLLETRVAVVVGHGIICSLGAALTHCASIAQE